MKLSKLSVICLSYFFCSHFAYSEPLQVTVSKETRTIELTVDSFTFGDSTQFNTFLLEGDIPTITVFYPQIKVGNRNLPISAENPDDVCHYIKRNGFPKIQGHSIEYFGTSLANEKSSETVEIEGGYPVIRQNRRRILTVTCQ